MDWVLFEQKPIIIIGVCKKGNNEPVCSNYCHNINRRFMQFQPSHLLISVLHNLKINLIWMHADDIIINLIKCHLFVSNLLHSFYSFEYNFTVTVTKFVFS